MTTEVLRATQDAYVRQDQPDTNYGGSAMLMVQVATGAHRRSHVHFPFDAARLAGATASSAILRLYLKENYAAATLTARRITQAWAESRVTYTTEPGSTDVNEASASVSGSAGGYVELDVTDIVQDWIGGKAPYGLRIATTATTLRTFYSSEGVATKGPVLTVVWSRPPARPAGLAPSGAQVVTAAAPRFSWTSDTPTLVQVQIDNATDFASPVYDSGWDASADTSYNTPDFGSPPSLTDDTTYYWRVRIQDATGSISDWSEVAEFQRRTKGILTIVAPGATVQETTPTISHTFTGRTQQSVQYILAESGTVVYNRPQAPQTTTDFELPAGFVRALATTYTVTVRVWDTLARSGTDGTGYVEDSTDFTFVLNATPGPVTSLAAAAEDGHVLLTWSRSTAPDYFAVREDGLLIRDRVEVSEAAIGGTSYAMRIYTSEPRRSHTYIVEAVVSNGGVYQHPDDSPSVALTFEPIGIWLIDTETGAEVHILGDDAVDTALGEGGATFFPQGRQDPVRIVDQVRGLEGTVSGTLISLDDRDATDERAAFLAMKDSPLATRRLVFSKRNLPVVIGESSVADRPDAEENYGIAFSFWQVSGFEVVAP